MTELTMDNPLQTKQPPHEAPRHLFAGIDHWDGGDVPAAFAEFEAVLNLQPRNDLARSYRALCLLATSDHDAAAENWRTYGFSDNAMFRVRLAEFIESSWLRDGTFMGESTTALPPAGQSVPRKALRKFYKRDFRGLLNYVAPSPVQDELEVFLAGTALEMLRHHCAATQYLLSLEPRRDEWPDALIALDGRLKVRTGQIAEAARNFAKVVVLGPEDFGSNYHMGIVCLAYEKRDEARQYFLRAFTDYMVDTLEFQWWQIEQVLLNPAQDQSAAKEPVHHE